MEERVRKSHSIRRLASPLVRLAPQVWADVSVISLDVAIKGGVDVYACSERLAAAHAARAETFTAVLTALSISVAFCSAGCTQGSCRPAREACSFVGGEIHGVNGRVDRGRDRTWRLIFFRAVADRDRLNAGRDRTWYPLLSGRR